MQPISPDAARDLLAAEFGSRRALGLHHAAQQRRTGFWADRPAQPRTLVYVQDVGAGQIAGFAAGEPRPAAEWLATLDGREIAILTPTGWGSLLDDAVPNLEHNWVRVRFRPESAPPPALNPRIPVEWLSPTTDAESFARCIPPWAWRSWAAGPVACLQQGRVAGIRHHQYSWAACAWIEESDAQIDAVGVFTQERYRRLGLGRAVAATLVHHVLTERQKCPMWASDDGNEPSLALAEALGFTIACDEPFLAWRPHAGRLV